MSDERIFSWAENADGRMVHVDSVPRGLKCNCFCPYCHEPLVARQGEVKEHGFAHHSENRQSRLEICYQVTLYKLAEQIIQQQKRIIAPSYYGIFPSKEIVFLDIKVDSSYEREDKQPDVVATTPDGEQYLIEFTFEYKVQHKQPIDYKNLNCIEIDLAHQSLDTLQHFLTSKPVADCKWVNCDSYFSQIEDRYAKAGKKVKVVCEDKCEQCKLHDFCCVVRDKNSDILEIYNNGKAYRLCKLELFAERELELMKREKEQERVRREQEEYYLRLEEQRRKEEEEQERMHEERIKRLQERKLKEEAERKRRLEATDPSEWSCFDCESNLAWANRGDKANCGCYISLGVPKNTPPETAKTCKRYRPKL